MVVAFGILAIVAAVIGTLVVGWIAVGIAAVFAALAIGFQIKKNNQAGEGERKKVGGIIMGAIGVAIALLIQFGLMSFADKLKAEADKQNSTYVSAGAEGFKSLGVIGFVSKAMDAKPAGMSDKEFSDLLSDELKKITDSMGKNN